MSLAVGPGMVLGMDTPPTDPLDAAWPPEDRTAARERCRLAGRQAGLDQLASVPAEMADEAFREGFADTMGDDWARLHDAFVHRVGEILRAPEAVGREHLARQLAFDTNHSVMAARLILRGAGTEVSTLPVGGARTARLAAMRLATQLETEK